MNRLRRFVIDFAMFLADTPSEQLTLDVGGRMLKDLVSRDDWLPDAFAEPLPDGYAQYLLHCDSQERFSVVSFVWGPGQATPVHNHTVWGLVGMLRGAEASRRYELDRDGALLEGHTQHFHPGDVEAVSPAIGDIHKVSNALADAVSVSIHVYGANIGAVKRATFDVSGRAKPFISGYAKATLPNFWDQRSDLVESGATAGVL